MQVSFLQNVGLQYGKQQSVVMHVGKTNNTDLCLCSFYVFLFFPLPHFLASLQHQSVADGETNNFQQLLIGSLSLRKVDLLQPASMIPAFSCSKLIPEHNN